MMTASSSSDYELPTLSLHDAVALGEVEAGLVCKINNDNHNVMEDSEWQEMERLPVLLRLLSAARPLASIPTFDDDNNTTGEADPVVDAVVDRLEEVAASYSIAEGVDVVACHLAPAICRYVSKLPPLRRRPQADGWETGDLVFVGANSHLGLKRKRPSSSAKKSNDDQDDNIAAAMSEGGLVSSDDDDNGDEQQEATNNNRRGSSTEAAAAAAAQGGGGVGAEDSIERVVAKTLSELTALVAVALEPIGRISDQGGETDSRNGKLTLPSEDSALGERPHGGTATMAARGGVLTGSDLASTVASLMHHAPVLRHAHVANALARATVPQASSLISRMGANCPSAVPLLLRGCMDAHHGATHPSVAKSSKLAIAALAELSPREKGRVRTTLQQEGICLGLQWRLAMGQDPLSALLLLLEHLTRNSEKPPDEQEPVGEDIVPFEIQSEQSMPMEIGSSKKETRGKKSLLRVLEDDTDMLIDTFHFLQKEVSAALESTQQGGHLKLVLRCYAWLVLKCNVNKALQKSATIISDVLSVLQTALTRIGETTATWTEGALELLLCDLLLTLGRLRSLENSEKTTVDLCGSLLKECLDCRRRKSSKYQVLVARLLIALRHEDTESFQALLESILCRELCSNACSIPSSNLHVSQVGEWFHENGYDLDEVWNDGFAASSCSDLSFLLDAMEYTGTALEEIKEKITAALTDLLTNPGEADVDARAAEFIWKATVFLESCNECNLPIVSPLRLEGSARKCDFYTSDSSASAENNQVLVQVLYWFAYTKSSSHSMFSFDVRGLPLKEMLSYAKRVSFQSEGRKWLSDALMDAVAGHCPEIPKQLKYWELFNGSIIDGSDKLMLDRVKTRRALVKALRDAVSNDELDPSGAMAESSFFHARTQLPDSDLYPLATSALLSTPNTPPPFITYAMLYHDPLVLLKAPMRVWQCDGLRRIVLSILTSLLETNEAVLDTSSISSIAASELISCQHILLLRCILVSVSGGDEEHEPFFCSRTSNFLRMLIAKNPGLVGMIVKQNPPPSDASIDWLVEFVPETMEDAGSLLNVLSGSGSITSRLTAAASILRIVIAHGHRDEAIAEKLVYSSLAQLVSSFSWMMGPVGVPVNVLIGDGSGQDVTQMARKATFRMLRCLVNVRGRMRPRIRNECSLALHKLASLCKGENQVSGVSGAVLARRKGLLREVFEAVTKAANAMGSGIEL